MFGPKKHTLKKMGLPLLSLALTMTQLWALGEKKGLQLL